MSLGGQRRREITRNEESQKVAWNEEDVFAMFSCLSMVISAK